jgi:hypothetical protein
MENNNEGKGPHRGSIDCKWEKIEEERMKYFYYDPVYIKNTEKLNISDVKRILIDFGIWLDKNDRQLENGNITKNVNDYLKAINYT